MILGLSAIILNLSLMSWASGQDIDQIHAQRIHEQVSYDWNGDGLPDRAILTVDGNVSIYLSNAIQGGYRLIVDDTGLLIAEGNPDQTSELRLTSSGALQLVSRMRPGPHFQERVLTAEYVEGQFLVTGFKWTSANSNSELGPENCEYNLSTGQGVFNGRPKKVSWPPFSLATLQDTETLYTCQH